MKPPPIVPIWPWSRPSIVASVTCTTVASWTVHGLPASLREYMLVLEAHPASRPSANSPTIE